MKFLMSRPIKHYIYRKYIKFCYKSKKKACFCYAIHIGDIKMPENKYSSRRKQKITRKFKLSNLLYIILKVKTASHFENIYILPKCV